MPGQSAGRKATMLEKRRRPVPPKRDEPGVVQLWVYRYWHPCYRHRLTLDCAAVSAAAALASAQRFLRQENLRLARISKKLRVPVPVHEAQMRRG